MNRTKDSDLTTKEPSKTPERRFETQDETPPDDGGQTKSKTSLPAMGDDEE